jgi:23S rRNA pseudouridine1911/1915/1917 synthase
VRYCDRALELTPEEVAAEFGLARQALHAAEIAFPHPVSGVRVLVRAPLPEDMRRYFEVRS